MSGLTYLPEEKANADFSIEKYSESPFFLYQTPNTTANKTGVVPWSVLSKNQSLKWYSTGTTYDPEAVAQGSFVVGFDSNPASTAVFSFYLDYTCEFAGSKPNLSI